MEVAVVDPSGEAPGGVLVKHNWYRGSQGLPNYKVNMVRPLSQMQALGKRREIRACAPTCHSVSVWDQC